MRAGRVTFPNRARPSRARAHRTKAGSTGTGDVPEGVFGGESDCITALESVVVVLGDLDLLAIPGHAQLADSPH